MRYLLTTLIAVATAVSGQAQKLKTYRSTANSYYWKNRLPDPAYWQQDVHYQIRATIDETRHIIDAHQALEYWNNSPDTLYYVYFHLYQNAFVKGSHLHALEKAQKIKSRLGKYEEQGLGTVVQNIRIGQQPVQKTELDNTILKVWLPAPLPPDQHITLELDFKTYYDRGGTRRRMQMWDAWGFPHYNGAQWYPKICVYDREFGWNTDQHMNREFYGDFGIFDVTLDFPSNYIVEATGALQNREEVLPADLREKLDMKHFIHKKWDEPPSVIIPYVKGERKKWHFLAENVHDFAFVADPSYRISTTYWNGVECVGIAQESHASGWQHSAELVAKIVETFSNDFGEYAYPKMIAADARDGMEYPMLTMDNGADPGYRGLLIHEIGHNWFYGMVGSNETYRAALDEGITQFLTAWGLEKIDGKYLKQNPPKSGYRRQFQKPVQARDARVFNSYLSTALAGEPATLNTHSDDFNSAIGHGGGYGLVYYKMAAMMYNLQYVLGDSLFSAAMKHYFHQWKMAHPSMADFRKSFIHFTGVDLNWFFDQWLETTKTIDYRIGRIQRISGTDSFAIHLKRKGTMQMPLDFTVTTRKGNQQDYHIPNTWFQKETEATLLPKWPGWGKLHTGYTARIHAPEGIKHIKIDTSERLADIYPLNNTRGRWRIIRPGSIEVKPDPGFYRPLNRYQYRMEVRPDVWWNPIDGIKGGIHAEGSYLGLLHRVEATLWWNTHVFQTDPYVSYESEGWYERYLPFNFSFRYRTPLFKAQSNQEIDLSARLIDGLIHLRAGYHWKWTPDFSSQIFYQSMWRPVAYDLDYLLYPQEWSSDKKTPNSTLNLLLTKDFKTLHGYGSGTLQVRAPFLGGNDAGAFDYSFAQFTGLFTTKIHKISLRSRLFGRFGTGSNIPRESALWLAGANPEMLTDNKYTRSKGFAPDAWEGISATETSHFHMGGGLNLRGYAGYLITEERNGEILVGYSGRSGAAVNIEADFDDYIPIRPRFTKNWLHIDAYLFADAGMIELNRIPNSDTYFLGSPANTWSDIRIDGGIGFAFTIKKWGAFDKAQPLTIRFDMPLLLNRPPHANPEYAKFRYVIGINRTF